MTKLVLVDGFAILHRAYHAIPHTLTTKNGEPINALYGVVSMFLRVIEDLKPTHVAVCFDVKEKTFRHEVFEKYQSQRPHMEDGLSSQIAKTRSFLEAAKIPLFFKAGFEADDLIGTIAHTVVVSNLADEVVIVTGDKDILQLVSDRVRVYMPVSGLSVAKLYGRVEVRERMGVEPSQIADLKALVGDPSDNYPGVSGIGPKTAITLIEEFGSLENIYKNLDKLPVKVSNKLVNDKENAKLSLKLSTIVRNVPINLDIEKASKWDIDSPEVLKLFQEFGFKTLTERVKKVGQKIESYKQIKLL